MPSLFVHLAPNILADTSEKFLRPFREALSSMLLLRGDNDNGGGAPVSLSEGSAFPASGADVLVTKGRKDTNEEDLQRCGAKLRVVIVPYAGPPRELRELLQEKYPGIRLLNSHYNAAPTAEYALGLLLAASKMLVRADAVMRTNDWSPRGIPADPGLPPAPMPAVTLYGKRVCIVGFGSIGKRVRTLLHRPPSLHFPTTVPWSAKTRLLHELYAFVAFIAFVAHIFIHCICSGLGLVVQSTTRVLH